MAQVGPIEFNIKFDDLEFAEELREFILKVMAEREEELARVIVDAAVTATVAKIERSKRQGI